MITAVVPRQASTKTNIPDPSSVPPMPEVLPPKQTKPSISIDEQETIIIIPRNSNTAKISTTDQTMVTRLNNLCKKAPEHYKLVRTDGEYENFYEVTDKAFISFRSKKKEVSEEQRAAASERFKQMHADGKITKKKNKEN